MKHLIDQKPLPKENKLIVQAMLLLVLFVTTFLITLTDIFASSGSANFVLTSEFMRSGAADKSNTNMATPGMIPKMADADADNALSDDCEFTLSLDAVSCGAIRMVAFAPGTWYTWTVNGATADVLPGSSLLYMVDGPGDYEICATQNITECEICETVNITETCAENCEDLSWFITNDLDPYPGIVHFDVEFDGDLGDGMLIYNVGESNPPYYSNDGTMGYQFDMGIHEVCVTYYGSNCSSTYCSTVEIGSQSNFGCTHPDANNYDPEALWDNGSCTYDPCELSIEVHERCDTLMAFASSNYSNENFQWTVNGEVGGWSGMLQGNSFFYSNFIAEQNTPYELCVESPHPACTDIVCETVEFGENCLDGCPMSQPSYTVAGCSLAVNLDTWNSEVDYTYVQVTGFEGTFTPHIPSNLNLYQVGSTIIFAFDEPGQHEVCLGFSNANCTLQWYCYEVDLGDCDEEVTIGCTNPIATNYNPDAVMNDGSCEYEACNISFEVAVSETDDDLLIVTPSSNYVDVLSTTWNFGDGSWSFEPYPYHEYSSDGPFNLCLWVTIGIPDDANCFVNYCMEVDASLLVRSTGFAIQVGPPTTLNTSEVTTAESLQLWPNPANTEVQVSFTSVGNKAAQLHIYDMNGRMVYAENWPLASGEQQIAINTSKFSSGVYLVQLVQGDMMESKRLLVGK